MNYRDNSDKVSSFTNQIGHGKKKLIRRNILFYQRNMKHSNETSGLSNNSSVP